VQTPPPLGNAANVNEGTQTDLFTLLSEVSVMNFLGKLERIRIALEEARISNCYHFAAS